MIPIYGWILNLGHRVVYTNKLINGKVPFPSWVDRAELLKHGFMTLSGMVVYHIPGFICIVYGYFFDSKFISIFGLFLWLIGTLIIPGYMTRYCRNFDRSVIFDLNGCVREIKRMGFNYWIAWIYVFMAFLFSFSGLLIFILGFLFTSVYFWQVAAYSFTSASEISDNQPMKGSV